MPSFVRAGGSVTRSPGVVATPVFRNDSGRRVALKRLAVVGNFPMLERFEPMLITSQSGLLSLDPNSALLKRVASIIFRCGKDPRVGNGPAELWLCSAASNGVSSARASKSVPGWSSFQTTIASGSNDGELPQGTINVESTTGFPSAGQITVETGAGRQLVTYTNTSGGNQFTGCTGGAGVMATGGLVRGVSGSTVTFKSKAWGYAGNRTRVVVTIDTEGRYTIEITRSGFPPERYQYVKGEDLFSLAYAGGDSFVTTGGFSSGGEFFVTASKAAIAIGTFSPDCVWDGAVTIDPSIEPNVSETYTVTVTGTDADSTEEGVTSILTWANGGGHAAKSTAVAGSPVRSFSHVDSVVFAQTGGVASAPNFTMSGDLVRVTAEQYPFVGHLIEFLQSLTDDLTVSAVSDLAAGVPLGDIDVKAATSLASAVTFSNHKAAILEALSKSGLIDIESVSTGAELAPCDVRLTGGAQSAPTDGDWDDALAALRQGETDHTVLSLLASSAASAAALIEHVGHMWGTGKAEMQAYTGHADNETKTNIRARMRYFNDFRISPVAQAGQAPLIDGTTAWLDPSEVGLMLAAMQCSVPLGVPLTRKRPNLLAVRNGPTWSLKNDREEMLSFGVPLIAPGANGLEVHRALTSHLSNNDPARTAPSAVESIVFFIRRLRAVLDELIGDGSTPTTEERIETVALDEARAILRDENISDLDEESITVEIDEDGEWVVGIGFGPMYEITHIKLRPAIIPITFGVAAGR